MENIRATRIIIGAAIATAGVVLFILCLKLAPQIVAPRDGGEVLVDFFLVCAGLVGAGVFYPFGRSGLGCLLGAVTCFVALICWAMIAVPMIIPVMLFLLAVTVGPALVIRFFQGRRSHKDSDQEFSELD